jgi:molecular chaperone GrpE (heat shock protein)
MFKKMIVLATILLVIGGFKNAGVAVAIKERGQSDTVTLMSSSEEESNGGSQNKEYDKLEEEMKRLMEEMKRLGKDAKERFMKDVLPRIRREMENFRKKLREHHREDEESEPIGI